MPPKRTQKKKQLRQRKPHNRFKQLQAQQVNVYTHRPYIRRTHRNTNSSSNVVVKDSFQSRLPLWHPFNVNVPMTPSLQIPVNVYVNGAALTHNTPPVSALATHISALPNTPHTPLATPHTPLATTHTPGTTPHTPIPTPRGKRGKKLKFGNQEGAAELPTIAESIDNLDEYAVPTLKSMIQKEKYKVHIPSKIKKNKLINTIKNYYKKDSI